MSLRYASYQVGILHWDVFRDALREMSFMGNDVSHIESSGWLSRSFTVKASDDVHARLVAWIDDHNSRNERKS